MLTNFQNFFTGRLTGKFATKFYLNIPPDLKHVAKIPCEKMSEKWWQSEICIVINDKSQASKAKHLSYDGLLYCKFITQFAGKRIFTARCYACAVLSMGLCQSVSVCLCLSQVGVLLKRLNTGSYQQHHTIAQGI